MNRASMPAQTPILSLAIPAHKFQDFPDIFENLLIDTSFVTLLLLHTLAMFYSQLSVSIALVASTLLSSILLVAFSSPNPLNQLLEVQELARSSAYKVQRTLE